MLDRQTARLRAVKYLRSQIIALRFYGQMGARPGQICL